MKLKSTQRKSLATVPTGYQGQERRFAQSVSENLDVLTGRRGDIIDRAVTFRDLLDTGVLTLVKGLGTGSTTGGVSVTNPNTVPEGPAQLPTRPLNFTASGGFGVIFLSWTLPPYRGHDYVEIYRLQRTTGAAVPTLAQAEAAGVYTRYYGDLYQFTDTNVGSQQNWHYWIRAVNIDEVTGPFYSSTGVDATTALDYLYISDLIDDILDDDVSDLGLNTAIDALSNEIDDLEVDITALDDFTGYSSTYNGDSLIVRMGDVETVAGNAATSAQLQTESTTRASADSALTSQITTLNSTVNDPATGLAATYAGLQTEITTRATEDSALSTSIASLNSVVFDATTGLPATRSQLQTEQTTRANADTALASDITTLQSDVSNNQAQIQTEATTRANADSALSTRTTTLETSVNDPATGLSATYSGLQSEQTTRANADSAIASDVNILTTAVGNNTSSISTVATAVSGTNGVESKYAVKVDTNGHVSGFGLISTANDGNVTSAFVVSSDRFAIAAPFNASSSASNNVGTNYPFKVFTTPTTVNGEVIPAGVYINDAFIHNAQITEAEIKDATITSAKIFDLSATRISSGNINIDSSNNVAIFQGKRTFLYYDTELQKNVYAPNFNSTTSGFVLGNNNGNAVLHMGTSSRFLKFDGGTGDLTTTGLEVKASDGTLLLDSGGTSYGSGANVIPNGFLIDPDNPSTLSWGGLSANADIIPHWEVADSNNGRTTQPNVSYWTSASGGVIQLFYGSTFRMAGLIPCAETEVYYLAVDNYMNNNVLQWSVQVQFSNYNKTFLTQTSLSPTSSLWDEPPVSSSQGAVGTPTLGSRYSVARITVPSNSNIRYMRVRFGGGSYTGTTSHYVNIRSVYLGKVPPVIGPKYASTYIRDLAVDTLQIAGNAVTVPIGQSNVNLGQYVTWSGTNSDTATGFLWGTAANTGSVGGVTAIPLSWTSNALRPNALNIAACVNFLGQSGSAHRTIRARIVYSTSPSFTSVTQIQIAGASLRTDHSTTLSVNATLSAASLSANQNYYFALQVHGNDQGGSGPTPWKIGANGISVLAAKK